MEGTIIIARLVLTPRGLQLALIASPGAAASTSAAQSLRSAFRRSLRVPTDRNSYDDIGVRLLRIR